MDLTDIRNKMNTIAGDPQTILKKLPEKYKNLDCVYQIWDQNELLSDKSSVKLNLTENQRFLLIKHQVTVYGAQLSSVKKFTHLMKILELDQIYK